jgi:hypothetical protein
MPLLLVLDPDAELDPDAVLELVDPLPPPVDCPFVDPGSHPSREIDEARKNDAIRFTRSPKSDLRPFADRVNMGEQPGPLYRKKFSGPKLFP